MKISAIVPSFNEEERIEPVLKTLTKTSILDEVIVINDGSTDQTFAIAKKYPVKLIDNKKNLGKGQSMAKAVNQSQGEIIFFCDADISGLNEELIEKIIQPVKEGSLEMNVLMRDRISHHLPIIKWFVPKLGGERALTRKLWEMTPKEYKKHFEIETALNFYARRYGKDFDYFVSKEVSQVVKEKKYGFWVGQKQRWGMMYQIFKAKFWLRIDYWKKKF